MPAAGRAWRCRAQPRGVLPFALLGALVASGCGAPDRAGEHAEGGRMTRRFLPRDAEWRSEAEIPDAPQKSPAMVIWEFTSFAPDAEATPAERGAADEWVARCEAAALRHGWYDFTQGMADGYRLFFGDRYHYYNEEYVFDDALLDCDRPEFLMYYGTPKGKHLAGLMFLTRRRDEAGPQLGGPLTLWHYHVWTSPNCLVKGMLSVGVPDANGRCERGEPSHRSPEMLHLWLFDHPQGRFATTMHLSQQQIRDLLVPEIERKLEAGANSQGP